MLLVLLILISTIITIIITACAESGHRPRRRGRVARMLAKLAFPPSQDNNILIHIYIYICIHICNTFVYIYIYMLCCVIEQGCHNPIPP